MPFSRKPGRRSGRALFSQAVSARATAAAHDKHTDADESGDQLALFLLHLARRVAGDELGVLLDFAREYAYIGLPNVSLLVLHDAMEADATCPACHFALGSVYQDLLKPDEAIKAFKNAADLDPEHPLPWIAMGDTNMWAGRFAAALECYDTAAGKPREHGCAHVGRAHALYRLDRTGESALAARKAREIATECFITSYKLGLFRAAVEQDIDAAIECFENCIRLDSSDDRAYSILADIYAFRQNYDKAAEYRAIADRMHNAPSPKLSECWSREQKRVRELGRNHERMCEQEYDCGRDGGGHGYEPIAATAAAAIRPLPRA